jgi:glycosyltransferase involved in cell wall biosynthesis
LAPPPGRRLLFVAGFAHPPNVDAAQFLVREILPLLRAVVADVELLLVGSNPTPQVTSLAEPGVAVTGWVSDAELARHYATARAAVVPLRFGAGVKGKVAEALREGVPLVTTPTGAQGLPGLAEIVTVSDRPEVIAEALATLLRDDTAWIAASHAQTAYAESRFGAIHMRDSLLAALQIAAEHRAARLAATDEEIIPA